jgi:hypothetical protein
LRGRWKSAARVADVYDDIELPYPDAKVAAMLCPGGPIKYKLRDGSNVTDEFILEHVVPKTAGRLQNATALVLGRAILWGAFSGIAQVMPIGLRNRIQNAYTGVQNELPAGTNPVQKIPIVVTGNEGEVYMDEIPGDEANGNNNAAGGAGNAAGGFIDRPIRQQLLAVHSQLLAMRRSIDDVRDIAQNNHLEATRGLQTVAGNVRRIAIAPARRVAGGGGGNGGNAGNNAGAGGGGNNAGAGNGNGNGGAAAALSPTPRSLYVLWQEYTVGIGGRKAAREFNAEERGRVKHRYTRRKVVWQTVDRLVRQGFTANVAIDRIYQHYGRDLSVTTIINRMLQDRRQQTVPGVLM